MIVADSDVLIDALRGREPAKSRIAAEIRKGTLATTSVNVFELFSGVKDDIHRVKVERLLAAMVLLPLDEEAGIAAAETRKTLESNGIGIGMADYLIAGVCLSRSVPLLTRNHNHFGRVPGLTLGDLSVTE
ncbi:MAG TPA: type II toxin-antitoxin system VapC family toxin [Thermoanaerobaculia bacterium]